MHALSNRVTKLISYFDTYKSIIKVKQNSSTVVNIKKLLKNDYEILNINRFLPNKKD